MPDAKENRETEKNRQRFFHAVSFESRTTDLPKEGLLVYFCSEPRDVSCSFNDLFYSFVWVLNYIDDLE